MDPLEAEVIRRALAAESTARLAQLDVFETLDSTNTYLLSRPPPEAGHCRVAIADHQSSGRGRHESRWVSPPGAGLCLSFGYTFGEPPKELASLTLAIGVGVVAALREVGLQGASLKWPNDIVADERKLGGILTELQTRSAAGTSVVAGIGLNVNLPPDNDMNFRSDWAKGVTDIASSVAPVPSRSIIAAALIDELVAVMQRFATLGFSGFADAWWQLDWLRGREVIVAAAAGQTAGKATGVDRDGALLIETAEGPVRVVSGSVALAGLHVEI